ncbi:alpha/beta hydrolase [Metabacillus sp. GX 13764]|uniref:alpha/beta hydrolase n=1 Tax=Metabacillus kandeliae TaxID=2900151 RepID=UPI001E63747B|nr:alpha/beta hydrolase-fold protein [Metabacillus kandeliae]MCD7034048.1 alpha/beta hydrolase [Metabacillus kandeliae]
MLEPFTIKIDAFGTDRRVTVYLPKEYQTSGKSYPVLYMHDGQNVFLDEEASGGISLGLQEYLEKKDLDVIVAAIDSSRETNGRVNEYCPWQNGAYSESILRFRDPSGGKGKEYAEFVTEKLKPYMDQTYKTDPGKSYMAGISLGAMITAYIFCRYPGVFKRAALLSPAFYRNQEEMEELIAKSDLSGIEKIYMDCGTNEGGDDDRISQECLSWNRTVYSLLKEKEVKLRYEIIPGALHEYTYFRKRMPEVLSFLLND